VKQTSLSCEVITWY